MAFVAAAGLGPPAARAQYPYGYGYGYGPGYNVPVTPGFGAVYGGSTFGSYGFGLNRTYTTFGTATGIVPAVRAYPATLPPGVYPKATRRGQAPPVGFGRALAPPMAAPVGGNLRGALPGAPLVPGVLPGRPR
jgi:hypothetical protein